MQKELPDIILYDGFCNLCNGFVGFLMKQNKKPKFRFVITQSDEGKRLFEQFQLPKLENPESVIFISGDNAFQKSDAALQIIKRLDWKYNWFYGFKILPKFLRDAIYDLIARNRYKVFGKKDNCEIPEIGNKSK